MFVPRKKLTPEEAATFKQAMAQVNWNSDDDRTAVAEVIVRELRDEIQRDNLVDALGVELVNFNLGETVEFVTPAGLKAYVHEPSSFAPRSMITNRSVQLTTQRLSTNPSIEITQLQSGRYGQIQNIRQEAINAILGLRYSIIWNTLINSVATTDSNYWSVAASASANAKKQALDSGMDYVADVPGSNIVAIVGRRNALSWLADVDGYSTAATAAGPSERKKEELDYSMYPGSYRSIPVIYLNQYKDGWNANSISENEIMVLGMDTIKLGVNLPLSFQDGVDKDTLEWSIHMYQQEGVGIIRPERNARIKLT